ncbi:MAG: glycosyltransferase [Myxococcales bacterium]|nr:glycosyltransferase [Myxococcales bacterium]
MSGGTIEHINSTAYWDDRFSTGDWSQNRGEAQTRFFGSLAIRLLPSWALHDIKARRRTVVDLGCAEGGGTVALAQALEGCKVVGVDFAPSAIDRARALHPGLEFAVGSLESPPAGAEVIFVSNVLEHVQDPLAALRSLAQHPGLKYLIVLVPLHEVLRHHEHVVTFDYNNFAIRMGPLSLAAFDEVDLRGTPDERFWFGKQAFAVWANDDVLQASAPTLQSVLGPAQRAQGRLLQAQEHVRKLEQADRHHLIEIGEARRQLAQAVNELRALERHAERAPFEPAVASSGPAVQFVPDREAEERARALARRIEELEGTIKWRWSNWAALRAQSVGLAPLLKAVRSLDEVGVSGTFARLHRSFRRRLSARRRVSKLEVDPWVSLVPLRAIDVQVVDESYSARPMVPFSVVTTVRNEEASIVAFLRSLAQQRVLPETVIVVDGGSTDETVALVRSFASSAPFRVEVVDEGPCNIAAGRNRGLKLVRDEVVVFLDAGCMLRGDFFSAIVGPFAAHPETDLVGGIYVAAPDAPRADVFIPDWKRCDFSTYLPSARAIAVRPFLARSIGGYPEYLTHTGEDTLFDIEYRRVSRHWVINRAAIVEWSGPSDDRAVEKLGRAYCRGDGESGVGDRRFYKWLSEFRRGTLGPVAPTDLASFEGFLEGRERRAMVETDRRRLRGVVVVLDVGQLTDFGGERRIAHLVTELTRQRFKVVHVSALGPDEASARYIDVDQTLLELYHVNDFDPADYVRRYRERTVGLLCVGAHDALVPIATELSRLLPHVALLLDEADDVAAVRARSNERALRATRALARARLTALSPESGRGRVEVIPEGVDLKLYRKALHERRPKAWPHRWKERVVICPVPFEVDDADGLLLRSVARACPTVGFVCMVTGWRFPELAARWGVVEKNVSGTTWRTPTELASWAAHSSAVVLPWALETPTRKTWASLWARRAAAIGIPSVARAEFDEIPLTVTATASSLSRCVQAAVDAPHASEVALVETGQRSVHRMVELFFDLGRT